MGKTTVHLLFLLLQTEVEWIMRSFVAFLLVCVVAAVSAADFPGSFTGVVGNNTVAFSDTPFITPAGLEGPVTVSFTTVISDEVQICFSPLSPFVGANLQDVCNPMQYGASTNKSDADVELKFTRKSFSAFSSAKRLSSRFEKASRAVQADDVTTTVNLVPGTAYYLTIASKSKTAQLVTVDYDGEVCPNGRFGPGCVKEPENPFDGVNSVNLTVAAGAWVYVKPAVAASWGGVTWKAEQTDDGDEAGVFQLFAGAGYLPDRDNHVDAYDDDDGNTKKLSLHQPYGPTWYVGLFNSGVDAHNVTLSQNVTACDSPMWDYNCQRSVENITAVSAANLTSVVKNKAPSKVDDENMDYFMIVDTHCCGTPANATHIRVSAAPQGNGDGPTLLARQGAPPTKSFYNYNSTGDYVNQLILPIIPRPPAAKEAKATEFNPYAWYVAVSGDEDYVFWAGGNCAGNCSNRLTERALVTESSATRSRSTACRPTRRTLSDAARATRAPTRTTTAPTATDPATLRSRRSTSS